MSEIKLSAEAIRYIALFESMTGAVIKDCIVDKGQIIYIVKAGEMGAAIGKHGDHINSFKKTIDKHIELIEYSDDPVTFITNAFGTVSIKSIDVRNKSGRKTAFVEILGSDKELAIGRNGQNIEKVNMVVGRHHNIDDVVLL
ncbi:MAG: NusA-like transcription termination signal-binding factor [Methanosarcinaceae archaeon]